MAVKHKTHAEVHAELMKDPEFAAEYKKTQHFADITMQLIQYRIDAGLTQAQLASRLKTTQSVISRLESFEYTGMKLDTLINYAEALDLDVEILIQPKNHVKTLKELRFKAIKPIGKRIRKKASSSGLVAS